MVFTRLSSQEKDAFFGLLDEYFQSRPDIFAQAGDHQVEDASAAAASAIHHAFASNPEATSRLVSAGVTHGLAKSNNPYSSTIASSPGVSDSVGRVAAQSLAFSARGAGLPSPAARAQVPSLPQRNSTSAGSNSSSGSEIDKLVPRKTGVLNAFKKGPIAHVAIPPAFPAPKNTFAPPPVRRSTSDTGTTDAPRPTPTPPRRRAEPEPEPEPQGEWAEVLYDYSSKDPNDLKIQAGTRVLVTVKSSEDWWSGQIDGQGREGLFPASYVTLL